MNNPLQAVVIGAGYFAGFHLDAWQRMPCARLAAIVESDAARHASLNEQFAEVQITVSISALSITLDIVDIATPPQTHAEQIQLALAHTNALIICQKPFCGSLSKARTVAADAAGRGRQVVVHENFRFQPWYRKIKSMLQEKLLGDVQQATFRLRPGDGQGPEAYLARQPYFQQMPRFLIHETGIHFVDVFRYLFGEPDAISAELRQLNPAIKGEDAGTFTFLYDQGLRAVFDGNRHLDHAATNTRKTMGELLIEGTKGCIQLNGNGDIHFREFGSLETRNINYEQSDTGFAGDSVYQLQAHVVEHLSAGTPLENTAEAYLLNQQLEELIYRASNEARTVAAG